MTYAISRYFKLQLIVYYYNNSNNNNLIIVEHFDVVDISGVNKINAILIDHSLRITFSKLRERRAAPLKTALSRMIFIIIIVILIIINNN